MSARKDEGGNRRSDHRNRWALMIGLALALAPGAAFAQHEGKSADEVAKELSNPAGSLASLFTSIEYTRYKGDLPDADDQDSWSLQFDLPPSDRSS